MAVTVTAGATTQYLANAFVPGTVTVSNMNGGSTFGTGKVVVGFGCNDATDPTSPQIGGVALTKVISETSDKVQLWYADVSAGTGDSFTFTNGASFNFFSAGCWFLSGAASGAAAHTAFTDYGSVDEPISGTLTIDASGAGLCFCYSLDGTTSTSAVSWTNATAGPAWGSLVTQGGSGGAYSTTGGNIQFQVSHTVGSSLGFESGLALAAWAQSGAAGTNPTAWRRIIPYPLDWG